MVPPLLIAVKSCQKHQKYHQPIRDTWGKNENVIFFMGGSDTQLALDEIILPCSDDYESLPWKTKHILEWFGKTLGHIFLCDVDTFLIPGKLRQSGFEKYDYSGKMSLYNIAPGEVTSYRDVRFIEHPKCYTWASGGPGYFLSNRAARFVAQHDPNIWAEDMWVGQVLGPEIQHGRFIAGHLPITGTASWHFGSASKEHRFNAQMIYDSFVAGNPDLRKK